MTAGNLGHMSLTIDHDPSVNAFAFHFSAEPVIETLEFSDSVLVDVDAHGRPVTLEVLAADTSALEKAAADLQFTEHLPVISAALSG